MTVISRNDLLNDPPLTPTYFFISVWRSASQLSALEAQLNEGASCDVEGWLLLAMHQLPRAGGSARAVLNTISVSVALALHIAY